MSKKILTRIAQFVGENNGGNVANILSEVGNTIFGHMFTHHFGTKKGSETKGKRFIGRPNLDHRIAFLGMDKLAHEMIAYQVSRSHNILILDNVNKSYLKETHIGLDGSQREDQSLYIATTIEHQTALCNKYNALKTEKKKQEFVNSLGYQIESVETFIPVFSIEWLYRSTQKISESWATKNWGEKVDEAMDKFETRTEQIEFLLPLVSQFPCTKSKAFQDKYQPTVTK